VLNRFFYLGLFGIALGAMYLVGAWFAWSGKPLSLAFAPPGIDILVALIKTTEPKDANEILQVFDFVLGVAFLVTGLYLLKMAFAKAHCR
jgi:hypothetical protein